MRNSYNLVILFFLVAFVASAGWNDPYVPTSKTSRRDRQTVVPASSTKSTTVKSAETSATVQPVQQYRTQQTPTQPASVNRSVRQPSNTQAVVQQRPMQKPVAEYSVKASDTGFTDLYSPFLDSDYSSPIIYGFTYLGSGDTIGDESFSSLELSARYRFAEFRNFLYGDLTLSFNPLLTIILDDSGIKDIPGVLVNVPLDAKWVWRFVNKWSFELGAAPGFYGDIEAIGDSFACPFRGILYYALEENLSFMAGGEIRAGWDRVVMPYVGLAWEPSEMFLMKLAMPRSIIKTQLGPIGLYGLFEWNNTSYALDEEGDNKLEQITISDCRFGVGATIDFTEDFSITLEGGIVENREVLGESGDAEGVLEIDGSYYFGVSVGSRF